MPITASIFLLKKVLVSNPLHTENPHYEGTFEYGRPMKGHGWQPAPTSELLKMMAKHITEHAPKGTDTKSWNY